MYSRRPGWIDWPLPWRSETRSGRAETVLTVRRPTNSKRKSLATWDCQFSKSSKWPRRYCFGLGKKIIPQNSCYQPSMNATILIVWLRLSIALWWPRLTMMVMDALSATRTLSWWQTFHKLMLNLTLVHLYLKVTADLRFLAFTLMAKAVIRV